MAEARASLKGMRSRASSLSWRFSDAGRISLGLGLQSPASENLHSSGLMQCSKHAWVAMIYSITSSARPQKCVVLTARTLLRFLARQNSEHLFNVQLFAHLVDESR